LLWQAFGVDLDEEELQMLYEWVVVMDGVAFARYDAKDAPVVANVTGYFTEKVQESEIGQEFMKKAAERGMDGAVRLKEAVLLLMFVGYGGTAALMPPMINQLTHSVQIMWLVELMRNTPEAVLLEGWRLFPPAAAFSPFKVRENTEIKWKNGLVWQEKKGDMAFLSANTAHHDPDVFGGPKHDYTWTNRFIPGRENADRIVAFGAEYRDIKKCKTAAGCPEAPNFCPFTHMSFRIARDTLLYFEKGIEVPTFRDKGRDDM